MCSVIVSKSQTHHWTKLEKHAEFPWTYSYTSSILKKYQSDLESRPLSWIKVYHFDNYSFIDFENLGDSEYKVWFFFWVDNSSRFPVTNI